MRTILILALIFSFASAEERRLVWFNPDEETAALAKAWATDTTFGFGGICPSFDKQEDWKVGALGWPYAGWTHEIVEIVDDRPGKDSVMVLRFYDLNRRGVEQYIYISGAPTAGVVDGSCLGRLVIKITGTKKYNGKTMWQGAALALIETVEAAPVEPKKPSKHR